MSLLKRIYVRICNEFDDNRIHATKLEKKLLKYSRFTIISNNCWGGWVYRFFGLDYQTPTIGLFFLSEDYFKFINDLKRYLNEELIFIKAEEANEHEKVKEYVPVFGQYPIGRLGDIDVHFLHYKSEEEAYEKWNRRKQRINYSRIIIKISTQNLWKDEYAEVFSKYDFPNKLLFTYKRYGVNNVKQVLFLRDRKAGQTRAEGRYYHRYMNVLRYINTSKDTGSYFED